MSEPKFKFGYREIDPPTALSDLAFCFFEFSVHGSGSVGRTYKVVPDGFAGILCKTRSGVKSEPLFLVRGISLKTFEAPVLPGDRHWGIRISPAANRVVFRCDPNQVPTKPLSDPHFLPHISSFLFARREELTDFESASSVFSLLLESIKKGTESIDPKVSRAVGEIMKNHGKLRIAEIADGLQLSPRQFERRFRSAVGLTPKQYSRLFRLRSTAISLLDDNLNWANRAAEMGYSDQSHLIRDFIELTGRRPKGFTSDLEQTEYGDFIK